MQGDIDRILISREQIARRVAELARRITADHVNTEITIVAVLTGAMIFCSDLIRQIPIAMRIGLMTVSSYPGHSLTTHGAQILHDQLGDVSGRRVLVVDDVLDSGGTLGLIVPRIAQMGAQSVRTCVLLRKDRPAARAMHVDYWGFEIPDVFVVGYGLDYDNYYRNLPDIVTLNPDAIRKGSRI